MHMQLLHAHTLSCTSPNSPWLRSTALCFTNKHPEAQRREMTPLMSHFK